MLLDEAGRSAGARRRLAAGILTVWLGLLTMPGIAGAPWQSPMSIREAARAFVLESLDAPGDVSLEAIAVDDRLKLTACAEPLAVATERPLRNGRGTVSVSCASPQAWRLFVPVRGTRQVAVVVAERSLRRSDVLTAQDVVLAARSSASLPYDYVTRVEDAVGLVVRRTVPAGAVLVPAALEQPRLVERGALVTLVSSTGPVLVKSQGVALEAAGLKQRIRVRTASGRVVEGVVESSDQVRVGS
jgi:flagella basal body P-ring formation protein FlgA